MADGIDVRIKGINETIANLKKYQVIKTEATKSMLKEVGFKIEGDAKKNCPVDTGRLRASLSTNWSGNVTSEGKTGTQAQPGDGVGRPGGAPGLNVVIGTNVKYAPYVEYGSMRALKWGGYRGTVSRLYLSKAYHKNVPEVETRLKRIFKK